MKSGETRFIVKKLDTKKPYNSVGFRLSNGKTTIKKSTDAEDTKDKVLVQDGVFLIPLQQADTNALQGNVTLEAQINYEDHSVIMSDDNFLYINSSLGYDAIQGSAPAEDDGIEVVMTAIEEGVAVIVNPEASQELIDAVTDLFQDTKQIAQSVRDDADNGEFNGQDGQDGFSPQVTVKTETPSTYVLHIKDADHEFDTPNLQGQGGGSSIEVGDGLQKVGNVISVKRKENGYILVTEDGLYIDVSGIAYNDLLRGNLTIGEGALASKSYVDGLMSGATKWEFVSQLPTEDIDIHTIYFVPKESAETDNIYDEWVYAIQSRNPDVYDWELLGTSQVDLTNYYTKIQTNDLLGGKVDKVQSLNNLVEFYSGSSNDIDVSNYSFITFEKELQDGDELTLYKSVDGVWHQEDITDSWYAYIFDADEIYFVLDTSASSGTREVRYSVYNDVIRQRQYSREIGELQSGKQDKIDSTHKLNADLLADGTNNKPSEWNDKVSTTDLDDALNGIVTDDLTLATNTESSAIRVFGQPNYNKVRVTSADIEEGEELHLIQLWDDEVVYDEDITDLIGAYLSLDGIDEIKFKVVSQSSATRHIAYEFNNPVARTREVNAKWNAKQDKINAQNKLDADLVDDTSSDNKFVTLTDIIAWNNKQEPISQNNKLDADLVDDSTSTNKFVTAQEKQGWNDKISVPTSAQADNGKFLRVVNGVATWQTVPQAESNSF